MAFGHEEAEEAILRPQPSSPVMEDVCLCSHRSPPCPPNSVSGRSGCPCVTAGVCTQVFLSTVRPDSGVSVCVCVCARSSLIHAVSPLCDGAPGQPCGAERPHPARGPAGGCGGALRGHSATQRPRPDPPPCGKHTPPHHHPPITHQYVHTHTHSHSQDLYQEVVSPFTSLLVSTKPPSLLSPLPDRKSVV